jgi:hypothetical protein
MVGRLLVVDGGIIRESVGILVLRWLCDCEGGVIVMVVNDVMGVVAVLEGYTPGGGGSVGGVHTWGWWQCWRGTHLGVVVVL